MWTPSRLAVGILFFATAFVNLPRQSVAGLIVTEVENNNRISLRQQLPSGTTEVQGSLAAAPPLTPAFSFSSLLNSGAVDFYSITGQSAGTSFVAWTDNSNSGVDTYLGTFGTNAIASTLMAADDDGGVGVASALGGIVNNDGTINLGVSGFPDSTFVGAHTQVGEYDLFVSYETALPSDVDIFQFNDLVVGSTYIAEFTSASFDTILGLFDPGASILRTDDDGGDGLLSRMELVPTSPSVILAVSGFSDFSFNGAHSLSGDYVLSFQRVVPEPGSALIWSLGGALTLVRRRKNARS